MLSQILYKNSWIGLVNVVHMCTHGGSLHGKATTTVFLQSTILREEVSVYKKQKQRLLVDVDNHFSFS